MSTRGYQALCSLSVTALLIWLPVPAVAGDGTPVQAASDLRLDQASAATGFSLQLAETLAVKGPDLYLEVSAAERHDAGGRARGSGILLLPGSRDFHPLAKAAAEQELAQQAAPQRRGFGRWLKKHWYVPVLAAVAVGFAVDSSGSDSDSPGEED